MLQDRFTKNSGVTAPHPVTSLIALMNEMVDVMAAEPDLVLGRKQVEHGELLRKKQKLALEYRSSIKAMSAKPELLKDLPEDMKRKLKVAAQRLNEQADRNGRLLRAAVTATQRLIQNIIAFIKTEVMPAGNYKNPHTSHLDLGKKYSPTCAPVIARRSV
jgi:hypothetical protein